MLMQAAEPAIASSTMSYRQVTFLLVWQDEEFGHGNYR
jgi:hypothetical protein